MDTQILPSYQLNIFQEEKEAPYQLIIGDKDRENRGYFALTNQGKNVFAVEEELVNTILLNMDKWEE